MLLFAGSICFHARTDFPRRSARRRAHSLTLMAALLRLADMMNGEQLEVT